MDGGKLEQREFKYKDNLTLVGGRKSTNDIYMNDDNISRSQFIIYTQEGNWFIKDGNEEKNSPNGTW